MTCRLWFQCCAQSIGKHSSRQCIDFEGKIRKSELSATDSKAQFKSAQWLRRKDTGVATMTCILWFRCCAPSIRKHSSRQRNDFEGKIRKSELSAIGSKAQFKAAQWLRRKDTGVATVTCILWFPVLCTVDSKGQFEAAHWLRGKDKEDRTEHYRIESTVRISTVNPK